jgi:hypothetical protein
VIESSFLKTGKLSTKEILMMLLKRICNCNIHLNSFIEALSRNCIIEEEHVDSTLPQS